MNIYFDLETIGTENAEAIAEIAATIQPPGNMSKADTIEAWALSKKPALVDEAVKRTSFDGGLGKIVCIGWAQDDGKVFSEAGTNEVTLLQLFFNNLEEIYACHYVNKMRAEPIRFVGHNIIGFDLPFLWQRAVINGIKPPFCLPFRVKPWDKAVGDTMLLWSPEPGKRISLDRLCKLLSIPSPKTVMTGPDVWRYYLEGRFSEIADYNAGDVIATRACYQRMTFSSKELEDVPV